MSVNKPIVITEAEMLADLRELLTSADYVQLQVQKPVLWCVLSGLQFALNHPEFSGDARRLVEAFVRMSAPAVTTTPALKEIYRVNREPKCSPEVPS